MSIVTVGDYAFFCVFFVISLGNILFSFFFVKNNEFLSSAEYLFTLTVQFGSLPSPLRPTVNQNEGEKNSN